MNLYIFEPHPRWNYMGGMTLVAADSFEEAVRLHRVWGDLDLSYADGSPSSFKNDDSGLLFATLEAANANKEPEYHKWVLSRTLTLSESVEPFVMQNGNYA